MSDTPGADPTAPPLDDVDAALVAAMDGPLPDEQPGDLVTLEELADLADTPLVVLEALQREGLLLPRRPGDPSTGEPPRWAADDVRVVTAGMALLEAGLPLAELLELARRADAALGDLADHAVETFLRYVRDPVRGTTDDDGDAAEELVAAFRRMLPATGTLVGGHFRRLVVSRARERVAGHPGHSEHATGRQDGADDAQRSPEDSATAGSGNGRTT